MVTLGLKHCNGSASRPVGTCGARCDAERQPGVPANDPGEKPGNNEEAARDYASGGDGGVSWQRRRGGNGSVRRPWPCRCIGGNGWGNGGDAMSPTEAYGIDGAAADTSTSGHVQEQCGASTGGSDTDGLGTRSDGQPADSA